MANLESAGEQPKYRRIVLKLSGEALRESGSHEAISPLIVTDIAKQILQVRDLGVEIAIVIGGGNSALEEGLHLSEFVRRIRVLARAELSASPVLQERVRSDPKFAIQTGPMGPERTVSAIRDYVAAFLDTNLRQRPQDPLLTGPSASYPDAVVTTKDQTMCRQP